MTTGFQGKLALWTDKDQGVIRLVRVVSDIGGAEVTVEFYRTTVLSLAALGVRPSPQPTCERTGHTASAHKSDLQIIHEVH